MRTKKCQKLRVFCDFFGATLQNPAVEYQNWWFFAIFFGSVHLSGKTRIERWKLKVFCFFFVASAFRPVWPGRCIWALVCLPRHDSRPGPGGSRTAASCQPQARRPSAIPLHNSAGWKKKKKKKKLKVFCVFVVPETVLRIVLTIPFATQGRFFERAKILDVPRVLSRVTKKRNEK